MKSLRHDVEQYTKIQNQLEQQNIDPEKYPHLLTLQRHYQQELGKIKEYTTLLEEDRQKSQNILTQLQQNRQQLTKNRVSFLRPILTGNLSVHIEVEHFGQKWDGIEKALRKLLQCEDSFDRDFQTLKRQILW